MSTPSLFQSLRQWWADYDPIVNAFLFPRRNTRWTQSALDTLRSNVPIEEVDNVHYMIFHPKLNAKRVIVYFHGNGEDLVDMYSTAQFFHALAAEFHAIIICPEYPGYSLSSSQRCCESSLLATALKAVTFSCNARFLDLPVTLYGYSLGGALAIHAAQHASIAKMKNVDSLILQSTFTSVSALANNITTFPWVSYFVIERFDSLSKMSHISKRMRVLFLHGGKDSIVPSNHSNTLHDAFRGKYKFIFLEPDTDHNNMTLNFIAAHMNIMFKYKM